MFKQAWFAVGRLSIAGIFLLVFTITSLAFASPGREAAAPASLGYYQTARLTAGDAQDGDAFGAAVAIDGNTAILGAPHKDDHGMDSGCAYIFTYDPVDRAWQQVVKLTASDAGPSQLFGLSVAIQGDIAFVGVPTKPPGGWVYMFQRDQGGPDAWGEVGMFQGDQVTWADYFGVSMDISGDLLIVGAYAGGDYDGTAYVFERNQGGQDAWGQVAQLTPADNPAYNYFGYTVAISGDTAVGGAPGNNGVTGAAYIFQRQADQSWLEVTKVTPDDGAFHDFFGIAVDLAGDTLAAGSPAQAGTGAVYLFERDLGGLDAWGQSARLLASDGQPGDGLGQDLILEPDRLFAGATGWQEGAGGVYLFTRRPDGSGAWDQAFLLSAEEPASGEELASALAAQGLFLLAGAPGAASPGPSVSPSDIQGGAVYIFTGYSPPSGIDLHLAPDPIPEGTPALLMGSFLDPDPDEAHALAVQWGDGSTSTTTLPAASQAFTLTHTYLDDDPTGTPSDPYTLTVTITDAQGGSAWAQFLFAVENISPTVVAGADILLYPGEALQRVGSFFDPGADTWTAWVDYGDGGGPQPLELAGDVFWLEHTYPVIGIYPVTVTILDDDGGLGSSHFTVSVVPRVYTCYLNIVQRGLLTVLKPPLKTDEGR